MSTKSKINFYSEMLFPFHFMAIGVAFTFGGLASILFSPILGSILLFIGLLIVTAYRGLQFDLTNKKYRVYNSFLFIKTGKWESYEGFKQLFIKTNIVSQTIYLRISQGSEYTSKEYDAYLEFNNGEKIYIAGYKGKNKLLSRLKSLENSLNLEILDLSDEERSLN